MARIIALCGKLCAGKSTYARRLRDELPAVVLGSDELTLALPFEHDVVYPIVRKYLFVKAVEIVRAGANAVLDFGFWSRADRDEARKFFAGAGLTLEFHFLAVSDSDWERNIAARNKNVRLGAENSYFVDEGLKAKCLRLFEAPDPGEMDIIL